MGSFAGGALLVASLPSAAPAVRSPQPLQVVNTSFVSNSVVSACGGGSGVAIYTSEVYSGGSLCGGGDCPLLLFFSFCGCSAGGTSVMHASGWEQVVGCCFLGARGSGWSSRGELGWEMWWRAPARAGVGLHRSWRRCTQRQAMLPCQVLAQVEPSAGFVSRCGPSLFPVAGQCVRACASVLKHH